MMDAKFYYVTQKGSSLTSAQSTRLYSVRYSPLHIINSWYSIVDYSGGTPLQQLTEQIVQTEFKFYANADVLSTLKIWSY